MECRGLQFIENKIDEREETDIHRHTSFSISKSQNLTISAECLVLHSQTRCGPGNVVPNAYISMLLLANTHVM
jgi:hypothetical protein